MKREKLLLQSQLLEYFPVGQVPFLGLDMLINGKHARTQAPVNIAEKNVKSLKRGLDLLLDSTYTVVHDNKVLELGTSRKR